MKVFKDYCLGIANKIKIKNLERLCVFGRDGCDGGEDKLWCIVALNKFHTSVETILKILKGYE